MLYIKVSEFLFFCGQDFLKQNDIFIANLVSYSHFLFLFFFLDGKENPYFPRPRCFQNIMLKFPGFCKINDKHIPKNKYNKIEEFFNVKYPVLLTLTDEFYLTHKCCSTHHSLLTKDVIWTSIQRSFLSHGRQMDVKTMMCNYWVPLPGEINLDYVNYSYIPFVENIQLFKIRSRFSVLIFLQVAIVPDVFTGNCFTRI